MFIYFEHSAKYNGIIHFVLSGKIKQMNFVELCSSENYTKTKQKCLSAQKPNNNNNIP